MGTIGAAEHRDEREHHDRHQRRRDRGGQLRQPEDDGQRQGQQRVDQPRDIHQLRELGDEHQDRQRVDESDHDLARDEAHELGDAEDRQQDLEDPGQQDRRHQVVDPVACHQRGNHQGDGTRRR